MCSVGRRVKGITGRLIFESQFDARYQRNPWGILEVTRGLVLGLVGGPED